MIRCSEQAGADLESPLRQAESTLADPLGLAELIGEHKRYIALKSLKSAIKADIDLPSGQLAILLNYHGATVRPGRTSSAFAYHVPWQRNIAAWKELATLWANGIDRHGSII